ncbi:polysaccharide pyruvyl transferase family protein [Planktomarina temperata]|nr:polysaccharide pyruvyl transferase family protein [Planktomarina temperata]
MKRIQIRSFIKGGNHGQYLQASGLANIINEIQSGSLVTHLNYENHFYEELKQHIKLGTLPKFLVMRHHWNNDLKFSNLNEKSDVTVYGSDMIWHLDSDLYQPDEIFFGKSDSAQQRIAYAPSTGYRKIPEPGWLNAYLAKFSSIGVRDQNTFNLVKDHSNTQPDFVIDPSFFIRHEENLTLEPTRRPKPRKNYISIYSPSTNLLQERLFDGVRKNSLPGFFMNIKYCGYYQRRAIHRSFSDQFAHPHNALELIANSQLLLTSTFHGVMMALMSNTPFIAVKNPNLVARLDSPISHYFDPTRLLDIDDLGDLDASAIIRLCQADDINIAGLRDYRQKSRLWLTNALKAKS